MAENNRLNIAWKLPREDIGLIIWEDALMVYNSLPEQARFGLKYDENAKAMLGSTPIAVANLDAFAQKYNSRTPNLRDLSRPEIMIMLQRTHYINARNLIVRSREDPNWFQNNSLLVKIYELAEQKEGSINYPFMIEGYSFVPNLENKRGYGLNIVANSDFKVFQDERFEGKYHLKMFSEVDELGIPKFDKNGSRRWYAQNQGLAGLRLGSQFNLSSDEGDLMRSNDNGRVIFLKNWMREKK